MIKQKRIQQYWIGFLFVLSILAAIIKIFVGFDIDEGYAVVMPYRILQGDILLKDMWEVHQTSSFLPFIFIKIFTGITKSVDYLVIYLRICSTVIHLLFSIWVYIVLSKKCDIRLSLLVSLLYFNFLPKWLINLDFSMQLVWGMTAMLILLYYGLCHARDKKVQMFLLFLGGIVLAMTVLAYPTMALLYFVGIWLIIKEKKRKRKGSIAAFTLGCIVMAALFFGYLLSHMGMKDIIETIPHVFSDGSHQFDAQAKWGLFFRRWAEAIVQSLILVIPTLVLAICVRFSDKLIKGLKTNKIILFSKEHFLVFVVLLFTLISSAVVVFANAFGIDWGPFRLQVRYLVLFVLAFILWYQTNKKKRAIESLEEVILNRVGEYLLVPSLIAFAGILIASNVGPVSSSSYLVLGIVGFIVFIFYYNTWNSSSSNEKHNADHTMIYKCSVIFIGGCFILSLIFCKGYYVRVSEYPPANILEKRTRILEGPAAGIYVYPEDERRMNAYHEAINQNTDADSKLLFLGTEQIANLYGNGMFVTPTTISTPAFNEQWITYFETHQDKMPDVIAIAKSTIDDRDKFFRQNPFGKWIYERYDVQNMWEDEAVCILKIM